MQCEKMFTLQLVHIDQLHGVMTFLLSCTVNFKIIEYTSKIKKSIYYSFSPCKDAFLKFDGHIFYISRLGKFDNIKCR
jgi:hypothetical protein